MTTGLAVTLRFLITTAAVLLLSGFTQTELEKAKTQSNFTKTVIGNV